MIGNKLDFSSFSGSVVDCNLEYKRSFLLNWMHSVKRRGVAVLCLVFITTCPDGSPRRTVRAVDCVHAVKYSRKIIPPHCFSFIVEITAISVSYLFSVVC